MAYCIKKKLLKSVIFNILISNVLLIYGYKESGILKSFQRFPLVAILKLRLFKPQQ